MKNPAFKAIVDLIVSPLNMGTFLFGFTSLFLNWGFIGSANIYLISIISILVSIGLIASKLIFNFDNLIEKAYNEQVNQTESQKISDRRKLFNFAMSNLHEDDSRKAAEDFLELYDGFKSDLKDSNLPAPIVAEMKAHADKAFDSMNRIVSLLSQNEKDYISTNGKGSSKLKKEIRTRKEKVFENFMSSLDNFRTITEKLHDMKLEKTEEDFDKITQDLHRNLEVAKQVQDELSRIDYITQQERE